MPRSPDEYAAEHVRPGELVRIKTDTASDIALLTHSRHELLEAYAGSRLRDALAGGAASSSRWA
jgi:hypothetical protein